MAENDVTIDATPPRVFDVLCNPKTYAHWVVGAAEVGRFDPGWPAVGATFQHAQGTRLLKLRDTTSVLASEPPRRLLLEARARPLVVAHVELIVEPAGGGTRVVMREATVGGAARLLPRRLLDVGIHLRNARSLRRLRRLAEAGAR